MAFGTTENGKTREYFTPEEIAELEKDNQLYTDFYRNYSADLSQSQEIVDYLERSFSNKGLPDAVIVARALLTQRKTDQVLAESPEWRGKLVSIMREIAIGETARLSYCGKRKFQIGEVQGYFLPQGEEKSGKAGLEIYSTENYNNRLCQHINGDLCHVAFLTPELRKLLLDPESRADLQKYPKLRTLVSGIGFDENGKKRTPAEITPEGVEIFRPKL